MALLLALLLALIPLAIAPGLFLYFDVTPKIVVLLLGTGVAIAGWTVAGGSRGFYRASREARWFVALLWGMAASLVVSTLASANPTLSLGGSNWRAWGLITQFAALALVYLVAACCARDGFRALRTMLRAIAAAGLIAAVYGILQYFGWDSFQATQTYHAGEGPFTIVRPPATLGHADYFAGWLLSAIFAAVALVQTETNRFWYRLGWAAIAASSIAIVLSGTRSAMLGLFCGVVLLALWYGLRVTRRLGIATGAIALASAVFFFSPAGTQLRARLHWSLEERTGGARLLLWRDGLRMGASRAAVGYGPETFIATFARHQSDDLSKAFPEFYHESPHNIFLDALAAQGVPGMALLVAFCAVGFAAAWHTRRKFPTGETRDVAGALAAALVAMTVSEQFIAFTLPTALAYYMAIAMLVSLTCKPAPQAQPNRLRWAMAASAILFAALVVIFGVRLLVAGRTLAEVGHDLDRGLVSDASSEYAQFDNWRWPAPAADLWYSRRLVQVAGARTDQMVRVQALRQGALAAGRAVQTAEDPFNAYYNLAEFYASRNDFALTEQSLRAAISSAPNWFKPHWMLAQVLEAAARLNEAEAEAARAVALNGGRDAEVTETLVRIRAESHK